MVDFCRDPWKFRILIGWNGDLVWGSTRLDLRWLSRVESRSFAVFSPIPNWLVVGPPLWKIWKSIGMMRFPIYGKIKNVPNHQPAKYSVNYFSPLNPTESPSLVLQLYPQVEGVFTFFTDPKFNNENTQSRKVFGAVEHVCWFFMNPLRRSFFIRWCQTYAKKGSPRRSPLSGHLIARILQSN